MSDDRWLEIDSGIAAAVSHFASAVGICRLPGLHDDSMTGYIQRMAFMHAMQSGYTSLETSLIRIMEARGEDTPSGRQWHADLIQRAGRPTNTRPPILPESLLPKIDRAREFRRVAAHAYDNFDPDDAEPAVRAAEKIAAELTDAIAAFRTATDP